MKIEVDADDPSPWLALRSSPHGSGSVLGIMTMKTEVSPSSMKMVVKTEPTENGTHTSHSNQGAGGHG